MREPWTEAFDATLKFCREAFLWDVSKVPNELSDLKRTQLIMQLAMIIIPAINGGWSVDERLEVLANSPEATIEEPFAKRMKRLDKIGDTLEAALDLSIKILREPFNFRDLPRSQVQASVALMVLSRVIPRLP